MIKNMVYFLLIYNGMRAKSGLEVHTRSEARISGELCFNKFYPAYNLHVIALTPRKTKV